jgi:large subunit ribosomal protein L18
MKKQILRYRRARRARFKNIGKARITVFRSLKHIYAQLISSDGKILAQASSLDFAITKSSTSMSAMDKARSVGMLLANRALKLNFQDPVYFDCSGFSYHGKIEALANAARENGMHF